MKRILWIVFSLIAWEAILFSRCYSQVKKKELGKTYEAAKRWVNIQEYEKAKRALENIMSNPESTPEQIFYSRLLLAQIYSEGRELGKSLDLYNSISNEDDYNMPAEHVCRYLDLLRRSGLISRAIEVARRYHSALSINDRFTNIESALNSYYQYYQQQNSGKYVDVTPVKTPNDSENTYAYGIIPYGADYLLLVNEYNYSETQSFYINARMVLLSGKRGSFNQSQESFHELGGFVQQGPATFFDKNKTVIFTANQYNKYNTGNRPYGSVNRLQLYLSTLKSNNQWSRPVNISSSFVKKASNYSFLAPSIDEETKTLYFVSDMKGGYGGMDIYYCKYDEKRKKWGSPVNMGEHVNTNGDELFPFVKNDTLLFSSNGLLGFGDQDIFLKKISATTEPAIHLPYPVNTQFKDTGAMYDTKSNTIFFASDRNSHKIGFILEQVYSVKSSLTDLILKRGKQRLEDSSDVSTDINAISQTKELSIKDKTSTSKSDNSSNQNTDDKNELSSKDAANIIHFELNKSIIRDDQYQKLDNIYSTFMADPSKAIITIDGHTDATGTEKYNLALSELRAKSVKEYLVKKGIPKRILKIQSFGFSKPIATCNKEADPNKNCENINALNRRCEVYIKRIK